MGTMIDKMDDPDFSRIIIVREENDKQLVSARELYEFIDGKERFTRWIGRMFEYGFVEHVDYEAVNIFVQCQNGIGGTNKMDYALTIDCAKQIAMLQRNAQGQQVRAYFIKCEELLKEKLKKQELVLPKDYPSALRALADAEEEKMKALEIAKENELKVKERDKYIKSNHHKVDFYDDCVYEDDETTYDMNGAAKIVMAKYNKGRNTMMDILRFYGVLMQDNLPYEKYIRSGYFTVKITKPKDKFGNPKTCKSTIVTSKGVTFMKKTIDKYYSEFS